MRFVHLAAFARRGYAEEEYMGNETIGSNQLARKCLALSILEPFVMRGVAKSESSMGTGTIWRV